MDFQKTLLRLEATGILKKVMESAGLSEEEIKLAVSNESSDEDNEKFSVKLETFFQEVINPDLIPIGKTYGEKLENFKSEIGEDNFNIIFTTAEFNKRLEEWENSTTKANGDKLIQLIAEKCDLNKRDAQIFLMAAIGELDN